MSNPLISEAQVHRDSHELLRFTKEILEYAARGSVVHCPCGHAMAEIPIHEVVDIYICTSCRRVVQCDPDKETVIYEGYRSS